ncbi:hypothetical protein RND71_022625 [Anisodus tanguticus]|uniref:Uncharacterized protein n=1 Tax=Anisodus tanguticus TaxID=243964 RepID=A0AAE1RSW8_9SOLA|nr:hypothetical protein RND71_022625 [Anisodus tanguticus]
MRKLLQILLDYKSGASQINFGWIGSILVMTQVLSTTSTNFKCQSRTNVDLPCIDEKPICDVHCESKYGGFYITSECHFVKEDPRKSRRLILLQLIVFPNLEEMERSLIRQKAYFNV